jgi:hypothetical protein
MAKKNSSTKKTSSGKTTDQQRAAAIAEIDARLDGQAPKAEAKPAPKKKAAAKKGAKAAKTPKAPKAKTPREKKPRKASGLDLAAQVLAESKEPLNAKTIAEKVIAAGWVTSGATPHATLYAAMIREIKDRGAEARFVKTDRGMFTASAPGTGKGA